MRELNGRSRAAESGGLTFAVQDAVRPVPLALGDAASSVKAESVPIASPEGGPLRLEITLSRTDAGAPSSTVPTRVLSSAGARHALVLLPLAAPPPDGPDMEAVLVSF